MRILPIMEDMGEKDQEEMLGYFKKVVHDISAQFQGGEQYSTMIDKISDINSFIVRLSQYIPISNEEKYELLSTASLKARGLAFWTTC